MIKTSLITLITLYSNMVVAGCVPFTKEHIATKYKVYKIIFEVGNIFNPVLEGENKKFHHMANKLHIKTKQNIVSRELLFSVGETIEHRVLEESERFLRSKSFLKGASVKPISYCSDGIVVKVFTQDNWSLQPGVSFGTSGGKSKYSFEIQEKNLFGFGKSLEVKYRKGVEREEKSIKYNDPNIFGTSKTFEMSYHNNSDGNRKYVELIKPFVSLNTNSYWGINHLNWDLIKPIYELGEISEEFGQSIKQNNVKFGKLTSHNKNNFHRIYWGLNSDKNSFFNTEGSLNNSLPFDRDYQYPWFGYEFINENYIKRSNFNTMGRTEDISLGHYFNSKIGNDFNHNSTHFNLDYSKGYFLNASNLINLTVNLNGIYEDNHIKNTHFIFNSNWHHFQNSNKTFYLSTQLNMGKNLFKDQQQYLGGNSGLRGFPFRYFNGDNKFLISAEQRFFHNWYPLKTFQFASTIFIDSGSTWSAGDKKELFTNIGIGFRFVPTRTSGGQVIHIDLAFPTNTDNKIDNYQLQIRAKKSF